jgi:hypothetical protein
MSRSTTLGPHHRVGLGLLLVALSVVGGCLTSFTSGASAQSPHAWTRSHYVGNSSGSAMGRLGCYNSDVSGRATLFFGAPTAVGGAHGATLWGGADRTVGQIGELVKDFIRGFAWCRRGGQQVLVGMGTSNSAFDRRADDWLVGHGRAWAEVVRSVDDWVTQTYPGLARVYGAWDAEPSWSTYDKAEMWMQGYNGVPGRRPVHTHFSADGCPRNSSDGGACNNGWNQHHLWRLSWEYDVSLPMPQIYATSGVNARQWQKIAEYGARHRGNGIVFGGAMTQWGACSQVGGCHLTNNMPHEAHNQLLWHLNSSPLTVHHFLETSTALHWHS